MTNTWAVFLLGSMKSHRDVVHLLTKVQEHNHAPTTPLITYYASLYPVRPSYLVCLWFLGPLSISHYFIQSSSCLITLSSLLIPFPINVGHSSPTSHSRCSLGPAISLGRNMPEMNPPLHWVFLCPVFSTSSQNSLTDDITSSILTFFHSSVHNILLCCCSC